MGNHTKGLKAQRAERRADRDKAEADKKRERRKRKRSK